MCLQRASHNRRVQPMATGSQASQGLGIVDYNPRFFPQFLGHFSTFTSPITFFVQNLPRARRVSKDAPGYLRPSFHAHFCLPLACSARPSLGSRGPLDDIACHFKARVCLQTVSHDRRLHSKTTGARDLRGAGTVDYYPRFFNFSRHFFDFPNLDGFFRPETS